MNDDRVFMEKKEEFLFLLKLKMPKVVIVKVLNISDSTFINYMKRLEKSAEWNEPVIAINEARPQLLKLYAEIKIGAVVWRNLRFNALLSSALALVLEEGRILYQLDSALALIDNFSSRQYAAEVDENYRTLIEKIFPPALKNSVKEIWLDYLVDIAGKRIDPPTEKDFYFSNRSHFVFKIIDRLVSEARSRVGAVITGRFCEVIDQLISSFIHPKKEVITRFFGLNCVKETGEEIGARFSITRARVGQINEAAIIMLKHRLDYFPGLLDFNISNAWEEKLILIQDNRNFLSKTKDDYEKKLREISGIYRAKTNVGVKSTLAFTKSELLLDFRNVDISVRVINCLRSKNIFYMWQLVRWYKQDLLEIRNMGERTWPFLEKLVTSYGLEFGMKFTVDEIAYLESKTTKI
jgi:hypothetical protein